MKPTQPPSPIDAAAYQQLLCENEDLRRRLAEAEVALCAMREGKVDALATGDHGDQVRSLTRVKSTIVRSSNMLNGFAFCRMHYEEGQPVDWTSWSEPGVRGADRFERRDRKAGQRGHPGLLQAIPRLFGLRPGRLDGRAERFETHVSSLDLWLSLSVYSPCPEHFAVVFDNITLRKRMEQKLRESQERFQRALESIPDVLVIYNRDLRIQYINSATLPAHRTSGERLHRQTTMRRSGRRRCTKPISQRFGNRSRPGRFVHSRPMS